MAVNQVKQWFPQLLTALDRAPMAGLLCAAALLFGVTMAWTRTAAAPSNSMTAYESGGFSKTYDSVDKSLGNDDKSRLREGGEIIDQAGYFRTSGGRLTFESVDKKTRLIALENRNLEKVIQSGADDGNQVEWVVSGTISEYCGANFLLLSRAELKTRIPMSNTTK
jgi:hypothetical protein